MQLSYISVVVRAYNVGQYIKETIQSIHSSEGVSLLDFEIIVVNDGSKDSTQLVVEDYKRNNPNLNLVLINQENLGVSAARNTGIAKASGRFLWFVDGDDCIASCAIRDIISVICTFDTDRIDAIKMGKFNVLQNDGIVSEEVSFDLGVSRILSAYQLLAKEYDFGHTSYLWKRDFLLKYDLRYPENITQNEDFLFLMNSLLKANQVYLNLTMSYYFARATEESASRGMKTFQRMSKMQASRLLVLTSALSIGTYATSWEEEKKKCYEERIQMMVNTNVGALLMSEQPLYFVKYYLKLYHVLGIYPMKDTDGFSFALKLISKNRILFYLASFLFRYNWLKLILKQTNIDN